RKWTKKSAGTPPLWPSSRYAKETPPAVMVRAGAWAYEVMTPSFGVSLVLMMVAPCVSRVAVRSSISIGPFPCVHGSSLRGRWYYNEVTQRITRLWRGVKGYEEHRR